MTDFSTKSDKEIDQWIHNFEVNSETGQPFYHELLEERVRRGQTRKHSLNIEKSLEVLMQAAIEQRCLTYGDIAKASNVEWKQARRSMSGKNGHLDNLLDICHARGLPLLTAICVNKSGLESGELEETALEGFVAGAQRIGMSVTDKLAFHHNSRDECWKWGAQQAKSTS